MMKGLKDLLNELLDREKELSKIPLCDFTPSLQDELDNYLIEIEVLMRLLDDYDNVKEEVIFENWGNKGRSDPNRVALLKHHLQGKSFLDSLDETAPTVKKSEDEGDLVKILNEMKTDEPEKSEDTDVKQIVSECIDDNGKKFVKIFTILYTNILTSMFVTKKEFLDLKDTDVITIEGSEDGSTHSDFNLHIDLDKKNFKELAYFGGLFNFTRVVRVEDRDFGDREPNNISYICLTTNQCVFALQDLMRKIPVADIHDKTLRGLSKLVNINDYEIIEMIHGDGNIKMRPDEYEFLFRDHIQGDSLEYLKAVESDKFHEPLKIYLDENNFRDTAHFVYEHRSKEGYPYHGVY